MLPNRVTAVDQIHLQDHFYLTADDQVFYFGEYTPRQKYDYSKTNQFISNFKKPISRRGQPDWQYKSLAIKQFTHSLAEAIKDEAITATLTFVPIPPSKITTDPAYDDRMWQVLQGLKQQYPDADCRQLVTQTESTEAFHNLSDQRRLKPEELARIYTLPNEEDSEPRETIVVVDDMLTTGSHFKAMEMILQERWSDRQIIGLFAARRALPPLDYDF